jgi:hypothetical protein
MSGTLRVCSFCVYVFACVCAFVCAAGETWALVIASAPWAGRHGHASVIDAAGAIYVLGGCCSYNDVWVSTDGGADRTRVRGVLSAYSEVLMVTQRVSRDAQGVPSGTLNLHQQMCAFMNGHFPCTRAGPHTHPHARVVGTQSSTSGINSAACDGRTATCACVFVSSVGRARRPQDRTHTRGAVAFLVVGHTSGVLRGTQGYYTIGLSRA